MKNIGWASRSAVGAALTGLFATSIVLGGGTASAESAPEQDVSTEAYEAYLAGLAPSDPVAAEALADYRALSEGERQEIVDITSDPEALREIGEVLPEVEPGEEVELRGGDIVVSVEAVEAEAADFTEHDYRFAGEVGGVTAFQLTTWVRWITQWDEGTVPPFDIEASGRNSNVYVPYWDVADDHRGARREDEFNALVATNWEFNLSRGDVTAPLWTYQQRIDMTSTTLGVMIEESTVEI